MRTRNICPTVNLTLLAINLSTRYWVRTDAISSMPEAESWSISGRRLACV